MEELTVDERHPAGDAPRADTAADVVAFERLFAVHERRVGLFLAAFMRDRELAEDVAQETFLVAYRERVRIPSGERAQAAWILTIAHHRALNALRGVRRAREAFASLVVVRRRSAPESPAIGMRDIVIRTLGPVDRSVLLLCLVHGYTSDEAAAIVGLRPDAVRQRLSRSRKKLERAIKEADSDG
jgi:RNA polymerase sigma-70 factor (ECF subfamily)